MRRLLILLFILCPLVNGKWSMVNGQGVPFFRNFTATEYKGHNMNFDIISGADGTIYVANFEGLLYYDNCVWHMIHTPGITRITAVFRRLFSEIPRTSSGRVATTTSVIWRQTQGGNCSCTV